MIAIFLKTLPFFLVIALGYGAARARMFSPEAVAALTRFVFYFALSAMLFNFASTLPVAEVFDPGIVMAYLVATIPVYLLVTFVALRRGAGTGEAAIEAANGAVNLFTSGGTMLVDGDQVALLRYDPGLGALFAGADEISPATAGIRGFDYGSLAGLFELKNNSLPQYQLQLDEMARALVTEFETADASLLPGQPGIFTDNGAAYSTTPGLAARISVNTSLDPQRGGALSRFRDGAGAVAAGAAGDPTQVLAFIDRFNASVGFDPNTGVGSVMTLEAYATSMVSKQHTTQTDAASELQASSLSAEAFAAARQNFSGVNTDDELQQLLLIEQSYAANAKMMTTVSEMMDLLLAAV